MASYRCLIERGRAARRDRRYLSAIRCFERASERNPTRGEAYAELGRTYVDQQEFERAVGPLRKAIRNNPHDAISRVRLGYALYRTGEREEGLDQLQEAVLDLHGPFTREDDQTAQIARAFVPQLERRIEESGGDEEVAERMGSELELLMEFGPEYSEIIDLGPARREISEADTGSRRIT